MTKDPENTNLTLWNRLQTTPAGAVKAFTRKGGFSGTAINGTYILKRLTEEFGPCGQGWRFVLEEEQFVSGHKLKSGDTAVLHIVRGHLDYGPVRIPEDGPLIWLSTSPQYGQTMLVDEGRSGTFMDEEAPKKSITDCISKCAVLLGIGADVHLGLWDDNRYVNARKQEAADEAKEANPDPADHHRAPEYVAAKATASEVPKPSHMVNGTDDKTIARQVFHLVKGTAEAAKDLADINTCLQANREALSVLERAYPDNYATLKGIVKTERERVEKLPKNDPALNDSLPDFA